MGGAALPDSPYSVASNSIGKFIRRCIEHNYTKGKIQYACGARVGNDDASERKEPKSTQEMVELKEPPTFSGLHNNDPIFSGHSAFLLLVPLLHGWGLKVRAVS